MMVPELPDPLLETARALFGIEYLFPFQRLALTNILESAGAEGFSPPSYPGGSVHGNGPDAAGIPETTDTKPHQIIILPTGAGKSLIFMLPSVMLPGPTLVIFPLLGLISDQARRCEEAGIKPGVLRGGQRMEERESVWRGIRDGTIKIILSNPETVLSSRVLEKLKEFAITHLVIDETHTVSEWGDSFRPVYLDIGTVAREAEIPVISAFTATASEHILTRIKEIIFPDSSPHLIAANPDRPNISYRVIPSVCKEHDLVRLLSPRLSSANPGPLSNPASSPSDSSSFTGEDRHNPQAVKRPAIVFCRTRANAEITARMLRNRLKEDEIFFYHAGLERDEKKTVEEWFFNSEKGILCATCAYGMGVDKRNVRTVIHRSPAPSVEAYLQESGRGGRDRKPADAIVLVSSEDKISNASPRRNHADRRYEAMLSYTRNEKQCRRETLLAMLQAEPETCFGCDICHNSVQRAAAGKGTIIEFVRMHRRRFTLRQVVQILSGKKTFDVLFERLWTVRGFGSLACWDPDDIRTAITLLQGEEAIMIPSKGFWKYRLTI